MAESKNNKLVGEIVRRLLRYYDLAPGWLKVPIRWIAHRIFEVIYRLHAVSQSTKVPMTLHLIEMEKVNYVSDRTLRNESLFLKHMHHGRVMGGEWDLERMPIEDYELYKFSKSAFLDKVPIEQTDYYQKVRSGLADQHISSERQLKLRMKDYVELFDAIKQNGFKSQREMQQGSFCDDVSISIDRNGEYILEDGRHRFIIAKLLDLEKIPVTFNRIHADFWSEHEKQFLEKAARSNLFRN